ncbi:MAG TPA: hypothetical protein VMF51_18325 [Nocardioides sp.]|uniref:hypothetical protein n=1 Tax=Nocardioides sp. TaxID=35761 RepID=UPI002C47602D|nr:hypothetical protein [Nocardioides sp.]HTW17093.1 hypothetical protein [Nocardioides sp.]
MPLPEGISTAQVTFGRASGVLGTEAVVNAWVETNGVVIWAATGQAIYPFAEPVTVTDGVASFAFPHVDQDGFVDEHGATITGFWGVFTARVQNRAKRGEFSKITKEFQVLVDDGDQLELRMIPDGQRRPETAIAARAYADQAREYRDQAAAQVGELVDEATEQVDQLVTGATTTLDTTLTQAEIELQAIATAASGSASAASTAAGAASDSAGDADSARLGALAAQEAAEAAQQAVLAQVAAATAQATAASDSATAASGSAATASEQRALAETARLAAEAARAAIPSMPIVRRNLARTPTGVTLTNWGNVNGGAGFGIAQSPVVFPDSGEPGVAFTYGTGISNLDAGLAQTFNVESGKTYTCSVSMQKDAPLGGGLRASVYSATAVPGSVVRGVSDDAVGTPRRLAVTFTATATGSVTFFISKQTAGLTEGATYHAGDLLMEESPRALPFFFGPSPGARWSGAARNSISDLLVVRAADVIGLGQAGTRYNEGIGSPEGIVTASPGAEYVDLAKTNGARRWHKDTGTGSTGWVCISGDTGWRDVSGLLANGWVGATVGVAAVAICRTEAGVFWRIAALSPGSSTTAVAVSAIPTGFRPDVLAGANPERHTVHTVSGPPTAPTIRPAFFGTTGLNITRATTDNPYYGSLSYKTSDPWPTTLPGTAA